MALKSETSVDNYIILEEAKIQKIKLETRKNTGTKIRKKGGRENIMLETSKRKRIQQKMKMEIKNESGTIYMRNGMAMEEAKEIRTERIKKYCLKNRR